MGGETAQMLTERTGGSDLGALETTATRRGDAWRLDGFKWFASNCDGEAFVVLAKPEERPTPGAVSPRSSSCAPGATAPATGCASGG